MRDKEIVGLWEAYLQVHQPKEEVEQLDEFLGSGAQKFVDNATKRVQSGLEKLGLPINRTPKGTTTQKQQQAKIKPVGEEVENWVNSLIDEGYDLSEYTWEDMYEMYVNLDEEAPERITKPTRNKRLMKNAGPARVHNPNKMDEETDLFGTILEHLVAEGYADTNESALVIMANMSEEWRESIVEAKYGTKEGRHKLAMKIKKGEEVGKSGPGTGFKEVEKKAKKYGASDPKAVAAAAMWKHYGK